MALFSGPLPLIPVPAASNRKGEQKENAPSVVALGGGHGLSASLSALRLLTQDLTAVVTVADDGGCVLLLLTLAVARCRHRDQGQRA
jgi:hypothetical protein